jgi:NAD(P)-dependent dehydrogenase (short-subunit alcohol dehydrogenase family)
VAADLSGRVALVTGAASGIGRASALAFASAGASVALVDVDADGLAETAAAARKAGSRAEVLAADVTDLEAVTAAVGRAVQVFGRLDAAHNNAGSPGRTFRWMNTPRRTSCASSRWTWPVSGGACGPRSGRCAVRGPGLS